MATTTLPLPTKTVSFQVKSNELNSWAQMKIALSERSWEILMMATECEKLAKEFDLSDPYQAGIYSGKAETYRKWSAWLKDMSDSIK
jgi:hypothetical protein